jgi:hypothetical protein
MVTMPEDPTGGPMAGPPGGGAPTPEDPIAQSKANHFGTSSNAAGGRFLTGAPTRAVSPNARSIRS